MSVGKTCENLWITPRQKLNQGLDLDVEATQQRRNESMSISLSNESLFGETLDDLIAFRRAAETPTCGACGGTFPSYDEVFSHPCEQARAPRGPVASEPVYAPRHGSGSPAPRPQATTPADNTPIDPAKVEAWLVGLGRKVEDGDVTTRVERAAREWIVRQDICWGEFMSDMQERAEKNQRLTVGQVRGIMNLWRAQAIRTHETTTTTTTTTTTAATVNVPAGRYAIEAADGHVVFYKVDRPDSGKWAGYTFVKQLVGAPGAFAEYRQNRQQSASILARIAEAGPATAALLFSRKFVCCSRCLAPLSLVQSRATGFGSTCAGKIGVPYLSRQEAMRVLREENISLDGLEDLEQEGRLL